MNNQTTIIKIKQGTIQLPQDWVDGLADQEAVVTRTNGSLVITPKIEIKADARDRLEAWRQARGMWKDKHPDPIKELEKMRKEWDRDLP